MRWNHGYFAERGYTYGFYPETMPLRLYWAALIQGHISPKEGFRYLDAGCGQGLNLILAAAAHPDSEFVGIDFLPEHIAHARHLAQVCGLSNVTFIEGDFIELAANPAQLGEFDFAVCHGISTWVAPEVQTALFQLIGQVLKPGGMFYNSYNTLPGWLGAIPFQHLILLEQRSKSGAAAVKAAQACMAQLQENKAGLFPAQPSLTARLQQISNQNPHYLVQEYNNQDWKPVFVTEIMDRMSAVKLNYLGSATLADAFETLLPAGLVKLLGEQPSPALREQLRDYATYQSFRRDLYVKGQRKPWLKQEKEALEQLRVSANPQAERPKKDRHYETRTGGFVAEGNFDTYSAVLDAVAGEPQGITLGELQKRLGKQAQLKPLVFMTSMLIHGGWLSTNQLVSEQGQALARSVNQGLANAAAEGAPYQFAASPVTGGACGMSEIDWALLGAYLKGLPKNEWPLYVGNQLGALNRALMKEGKSVTDSATLAKLLSKSVSDFKNKKLALHFLG
jgi:SAM-dependent methyltransferase